VSRREFAAAMAAYSGLALWWLWPMPTLWATHSSYFHAQAPAAISDCYLVLWILSWDTHALLTAPWRLFHANIFYPAPLSLAYSENLLGYVPLFAPTYLASGNPVLALNVLVFLTYPLSAVATYVLARRWVSGPAAALAGFLFAFCVTRYRLSPQFQLYGVQYFPVVLLLSERWLDRARAKDAVLLAGAMLLQALSSVYLAYALAIAHGTYLLLALARRWKSIDGRRLIGLALVLGSVALGVALVSLPYLRLGKLGLIPDYRENVGVNISLLPFFAAVNVRNYLRDEGVGPVGYVLAALAVLPGWRRLRFPRALGALLVVVATLLAFGPTILVRGYKLWSPYALLMDWVPGFATVRGPFRFLVVTQLGLALLAGLGLERMLAYVPSRGRWPLAIAIGYGALVAYGTLPALPVRAEPTGAAVPPAYRWLAQRGEGRALLEEPSPLFVEAGRRMYFSTYHWLPIVDGYGGYPPGTAIHIHGITSRFPDSEAVQELADTVDIGWILVHRDQLDPDAATRWSAPLPDGLEVAGEWGTDLLLRVTRAVRNDRRARFANTEESLGGVPLVPLGPDCPGQIRLLKAPPDPWPARSDAVIEVDVRNKGTKPWPGDALFPHHTVRMKVGLLNPDGSAMPPTIIRLPVDLIPGTARKVLVLVKAPAVAGDYRMGIELVQVQAGPLSACGVHPLEVPVRVGAKATTP
jgi:hypothetical protein